MDTWFGSNAFWMLVATGLVAIVALFSWRGSASPMRGSERFRRGAEGGADAGVDGGAHALPIGIDCGHAGGADGGGGGDCGGGSH